MEYKISLLSRVEYLKHKSVIPLVDKPWWLRSPGHYSSNAIYVTDYGYLNDHYDVDFTLGIRPALTIFNPYIIYDYGSEITVGKYKWTVLRSSMEECYALCTEIVTKRCFDSKSNNYVTSEIKRWLENDFQWFDFCKYCFDCTCDPDGELTPKNDYSSCSIGESAKGHRIMFSSGCGKPPRIEVDVWDDTVERWITTSSYTPEYCPNCGRKINKEIYKR